MTGDPMVSATETPAGMAILHELPRRDVFVHRSGLAARDGLDPVDGTVKGQDTLIAVASAWATR